MPTFRVRNLSVTLDAVEKAAAAGIDQLCVDLTRYCRQPSILNCEGVSVTCLFNSEPICVRPTDIPICVWPTDIPICVRPTDIPICARFTDNPICVRFTIPVTCLLSCPPLSGGCGLLASTLPDPFDPLTPRIKTIEDKDILKELEIQLSDAMKAIKERGIELDNKFRPQSLADAEAVEKELEAALAELKEMKKDLE